MEQFSGPPTLKFGSYVADFRTGELFKNGARIRLQEKPLRALAILAERQGQLVTREDLRRRLWPDDTFVDFETGLNTAVSKLRDALSDSSEKPRYIETIPRRGYRFLVPVTVGESPADARGMRRPGPSEGAPVRSVAVLPFENLSGDPGQDYLSDGMTDTLITVLSKIGALRIISRTSVMQYRKVQKPLSEIARELGVEFVVEGSVLQIGDRVRIAAQLIDGAQDRHLWVETYEGDFSEMLSLLDRTSESVAFAVARKMGQSVGSPARPSRRIDPCASQAYLKGRHAFYRYTEEGLRAAIEWYQKAIEADPNFALAYSAMAHAYCAMVAPVSALAPGELFGKAEALARKALSLDDSIAEARFVLGLRELMYRWDFEAGAREAGQALALDPNSATARVVLSICHLMIGENTRAVHECEHACLLDPFSPFTLTALTYSLYLTRRFPDLKENLDAGRARLTGFFKFHILQGLSDIHERRWEPAIDEFRKALNASGGCSYAKAHLAYALASSGRHTEARGLIQEMLQLAAVRYIPAIDIAIAIIGLGDTSEAIDWLEKAYQERSSYLIFVVHDTIFDPLWLDPRFQNLVQRLGLARAQARMRPDVNPASWVPGASPSL
jgi:TolB-like protein/Flp pilus assembly protein TadD